MERFKFPSSVDDTCDSTIIIFKNFFHCSVPYDRVDKYLISTCTDAAVQLVINADVITRFLL